MVAVQYAYNTLKIPILARVISIKADVKGSVTALNGSMRRWRPRPLLT
jgi:hypothetical protein